ncbi:hypothetical protein [Marivita sp. XM-24bin2]|jgi:vacuolar-type H+-ATPase subunit H|uniref:hypothetical protein n=1 Tax=unclassified Marivita TaxID=2632480 RepID=UPI000D7B7DCB|nr:hypothetical protein [Marivita sp. XM-24bin2]MCR9108870.1 hypothetical protein [Paracoccaceae bacterium]PWL34926.1 MAG: hypothetical protein DCO97_11830 [Marivita sp. XM-24bin2]
MPNTQSTIHTAKERATKLANDATDHVSAAAQQQAEQARSEAIDTAESTASAADAAGDEFDSDSLQAAALNQISAQISSVAAQLRDKPVDEMADDVAVFARKNPLLFLGGAALLGFAAARFIKSGEGTHSTAEDETDPWSGHLQSAEVEQ